MPLIKIILIYLYMIGTDKIHQVFIKIYKTKLLKHGRIIYINTYILKRKQIILNKY